MALSLRDNKPNREPQLASEGNLTASIDQGVQVEGKLNVASGTARLNSVLKGEITGHGTIIVADQGEVEADIEAAVVSIRGKVRGTIRTTDRLEVLSHGVLLGDIHTPVLVVEPGGYLEGYCHMLHNKREEKAPGPVEVTEKAL